MQKKEIRKDLYTQAEYARLINKDRARVNQMVKNGELNVVKINGAMLVKV